MPHHPRHDSHYAHARRALVAPLGMAIGLALGASTAQAALPSATPGSLAASAATTSPVQAIQFAPGATGLATPGATEFAQRARSRCDRLQRQLKRKRDDGTLNSHDFRRLRRDGC